jgi:phenylalanyl-tRNA synthetase beta chain
MPTITLNKNEVLKLAGRKIPDNVLHDRIPMLGVPLEEMKGNELTIEVFANRPDMLTEEGFARALSSFLSIKPGLRHYKVNSSTYKFTIDKKVKNVRPAVAAAIIKDINMDSATIKSIMDMQDKLTLTHGRNRKKVAIGIHNLDAITFPLIYTTKPRNFSFTPLGTNKSYTLDQILKLHPKGKEFGHIIEKFQEFPLWLDKKGQVLSMPPVINAEETKITSSTKNLFIDITGTDQVAVEQALNIIVANLSDRGGKIVKINNFPNMEPQKIKIDLKKVNQLLGLNIKEQEIKKLLERMGMSLQGNAVIYPPYRTDILHPYDVITDIAIAYGFENFIPDIPKIATIAQEHPTNKLKNKIAEVLVGSGMTEVSTNHLTNREREKAVMLSDQNCITIINPKSEEYDTLRTSLLISLLDVIKRNKHHEYPQHLFEIGAVFKKQGKEYTEENKIALATADTIANFTQIRQKVEALLITLNITNYKIKEKEHPSFVKGRVASLIIDNQEAGIFGEIHPQVLENMGIEVPVAAAELNLKEIN